MDFLRQDRLAKWRATQPKDIAAVTEDPVKTDEVFVARVAQHLPNITSAAESLAFAGEHADDFIALGRAGRLRFLAWVLSKKFEDTGVFQNALNSDMMLEDDAEGETGSGDGRKKIAPIFQSDILALAEALGPRIAAQIVDSQTLDAVAGASLEVAAEFEMKGRM